MGMKTTAGGPTASKHSNRGRATGASTTWKELYERRRISVLFSLPLSVYVQEENEEERRSEVAPGGLQHDSGGSAGPAAYHGDLQQHHPLCAGLQCLQQDHRAHPEQVTPPLLYLPSGSMRSIKILHRSKPTSSPEPVCQSLPHVPGCSVSSRPGWQEAEKS